MKRFEFSLERVRRWRKTQVEVEQAGLDRIRLELERLQRLRQELRQQLDEAGASAQRDASAGAVLDAEQFSALEAFREFVKKKELEITVEESQCQQRLAAQRQKVIEARQKLTVLDRLRERAVEEWNRDYNREIENDAADLYAAKLMRGGG